jgi:stress response protein SCP2
MSIKLLEIVEMTDEIKVCSVPVFSDSNSDGLPLTGVTAYLWEVGQTLRVRFLDGDPVVKAKVEEVAHQWSKFANIKFQFGDDPDAEIRISFTKEGSWSQLGTGALQVDRSEPTMNFGWLKPDSSDEEYSRVVLHEFGHALGFTHEHKHPDAGIRWNRAAVIDHYLRTNGWSEAETERNVLQAESKDATQYSAFDRDSIMLYAIPPELTTDGFSTNWNKQLSTTDKQFASKLYPASSRAGDLYWSQHDGWQDGSIRWKGRNKVGNGGWQAYISVFASSNGIIYAITASGDLYWYQHDGWQDGSVRWKGRNKVGNGGWQAYISVFASSNGIIYAVDASGDLYWYQHDGWQDGSVRWKGRNKVGSGGWQAYISVFASSNGIIYAVDASGDLYWYQHDGWQDGSVRWKGRNKVGSGGWQDYKSVFASSDGILFGVNP